MCLIALNEKTNEIDVEALVRGYNTNSHAFGVMGLDRETGKALIFRSIGHNPKLLRQEVERIAAASSTLAVHLRFQTHGQNDIRNCHPYKIQFKDGRRYFVMHNGVFRAYGNNKDSDTLEVVRKVIQPIVSRAGALTEPGMKDLLETFAVANSSKLVILDEDRKEWHTFNAKAGTVEGDIWYSNGGYKQYVYTSCKGYGNSAGRYREYGWDDGYGYDYDRTYPPAPSPKNDTKSPSLLTYNKKTGRFCNEETGETADFKSLTAQARKELEQEFLEVFGGLSAEGLLDVEGNQIDGLTDAELQFLEVWKAQEIVAAEEEALRLEADKKTSKLEKVISKTYNSIFPGKTKEEVDAMDDQDWERGMHQQLSHSRH